MPNYFRDKYMGWRHREIFGAALVAFFVRIFGALSGFVATIFIARGLGAEQSGYYFLAFSIITVISAISRVGLDNTLIRFVGAAPSQSSVVLRKSLFISGLLGLLLSVGLYLFSVLALERYFDFAAMSGVIKKMSFAVLGLAVCTLMANVLQGLRKVSASIFILNIFTNISLAIFVVTGLATDAERLSSLYVCAVFVAAAIGVVFFICYKPEQQKLGPCWREIFASCLPLWAVTVMAQLVQWSGQFVAGAYVNSEIVAQLAVAQRTAMLTSFVLVAVNLVVAPRFSSLHHNSDRGELESLAKSSVKMVSVSALPIVGLMFIFPGLIMNFFGQGFSGGALFLQILAVGQFVNAITGPVGYLLMMSGNEKDMRSVTLISGGMALFLTWGLTFFYGATGNAVGTAVAVGLQNILAVYFVKKRLGFNILAIWRS